MLREIINQIEFKTPTGPIEVFFGNKYDANYYIRGQIDFFSEDSVLVNYDYYFMVIFLVHEKYSIRKDTTFFDTNRISELGKIYGTTKEQYLENVKTRLADLFIERGYNEQEISPLIQQTLCSNNDPLVINYSISNLLPHAKANSVIKKFIKDKQEIILYSIELINNKSTSIPKNQKKTTNIYELFARYFSDYSVSESIYEGGVKEVFDQILTLRNRYFYTRPLSENTYYKLINRISNLASEWIQNQSVATKYLAKLNSFISDYRKYFKDRGKVFRKKITSFDPLIHFCCKLFDDLLRDLEEKKKIKSCDYVDCGQFFKYKKEKTLCNQEDDGRNCYNIVNEPKSAAIQQLTDLFKQYNIDIELSLVKAIRLCNEFKELRNILIRAEYKTWIKQKYPKTDITRIQLKFAKEIGMEWENIKKIIGYPKK